MDSEMGYVGVGKGTVYVDINRIGVDMGILREVILDMGGVGRDLSGVGMDMSGLGTDIGGLDLDMGAVGKEMGREGMDIIGVGVLGKGLVGVE